MGLSPGFPGGSPRQARLRGGRAQVRSGMARHALNLTTPTADADSPQGPQPGLWPPQVAWASSLLGASKEMCPKRIRRKLHVLLSCSLGRSRTCPGHVMALYIVKGLCERRQRGAALESTRPSPTFCPRLFPASDSADLQQAPAVRELLSHECRELPFAADL